MAAIVLDVPDFIGMLTGTVPLLRNTVFLELVILYLAFAAVYLVVPASSRSAILRSHRELLVYFPLSAVSFLAGSIAGALICFLCFIAGFGAISPFM